VTKEEGTKKNLEVEKNIQDDAKEERKEDNLISDSEEKPISEEKPSPADESVPAEEPDTEEKSVSSDEPVPAETESAEDGTSTEEKPVSEEKPSPVAEEEAATEEAVISKEESGSGDTQTEEEEPVEQAGDLDFEDEQEYTKKEFEFLEKMYTETLIEIVEGEIVSGKILSINDKEVAVDIGFKSEGTIPIEEFESPDNLKVGEEIEVFLDSIEDKDGQLVLSKEKANFTRVWERIVRMYEDNEIIEGKCVRRIKGGMVVDLMGIDAFLPGSQIDVKPIRDFDAYVGKTLKLKVVKVNHLRKNIVVSCRVLIEEGLSKQREQILAELEKGQVREGVVKNITDFGVFIDLGGVDGLLHITDLSWGRVSHPSEIVDFDQKINVMILDFNENKERISLGLKQLSSPPWENIEHKFPIGKRIKGKVVSITDYGAFIELEKGVEGLIHVSEMSWTQHIMHPSKLLQIGEEVETVILSIDKENKKISLGLKQTEPDPWLTLEKKYPIGSQHKGIVRNLTHFGVFVELEDGIDGLVHISDLSWTRKVRHPSEVVKKGDEIEVIVLNISRQDRRISLGHKQIDENPWDRFEKMYSVGANTTGKVVRLIEKGLIVELPLEVEGFIPSNHLSPDIKKSIEKNLVGSELNLKVIEFDKENKKIVLSQVDFLKDTEKKDLDKYMKDQVGKKFGDGTIGEMIPEFKDIRDKMHIEIEEVDVEKIKEKKPEKKAAEKKEKEVKPEKAPEEKAPEEKAPEKKTDDKAEEEVKVDKPEKAEEEKAKEPEKETVVTVKETEEKDKEVEVVKGPEEPEKPKKEKKPEKPKKEKKTVKGKKEKTADKAEQKAEPKEKAEKKKEDKAEKTTVTKKKATKKTEPKEKKAKTVKEEEKKPKATKKKTKAAEAKIDEKATAKKAKSKESKKKTDSKKEKESEK